APAPAEQHDAVAAHPGGAPLDAFLVGVLVGLQAPFDVDLLALHEILGQRFSLLAPQVNVVPFGAFLALTRLVVPHLGGRDAELRHGGAAWRVPQLRVAAQIANKNHPVHAAHIRPAPTAAAATRTLVRGPAPRPDAL